MLIRVSEKEVVNTTHMVNLQYFGPGYSWYGQMCFIDGTSVKLSEGQYERLLSVLKCKDISCASTSSAAAA